MTKKKPRTPPRRTPRSPGCHHTWTSSMKAFARFLCVLSLTAFCVACGGGGGAAPPPPPPPPLSTGPEACTNGSAGDFSCSGISLRKRVSVETPGGCPASRTCGRRPKDGRQRSAAWSYSTTSPSSPRTLARSCATCRTTTASRQRSSGRGSSRWSGA